MACINDVPPLVRQWCNRHRRGVGPARLGTAAQASAGQVASELGTRGGIELDHLPLGLHPLGSRVGEIGLYRHAKWSPAGSSHRSAVMPLSPIQVTKRWFARGQVPAELGGGEQVVLPGGEGGCRRAISAQCGLLRAGPSTENRGFNPVQPAQQDRHVRSAERRKHCKASGVPHEASRIRQSRHDRHRIGQL
jgi:hypothetical protein